jgi:hypothetical protein
VAPKVLFILLLAHGPELGWDFRFPSRKVVVQLLQQGYENNNELALEILNESLKPKSPFPKDFLHYFLLIAISNQFYRYFFRRLKFQSSEFVNLQKLPHLDEAILFWPRLIQPEFLFPQPA